MDTVRLMKSKGQHEARDVQAEGLCSLLGSGLAPALGRPDLAAFLYTWWQQPLLKTGVHHTTDLAALGHGFRILVPKPKFQESEHLILSLSEVTHLVQPPVARRLVAQTWQNAPDPPPH